MPSAPRLALLTGNALVGVALVATYDFGLGRARWHDDVAYVALIALAAVSWPWLRRRRLTTLVLASAGAWCALTGLALVYVTPGVARRGSMDWWHGVTGAAFALAFLAHWARNQPRLTTLLARLASSRRLAVGVALAWGLTAAAVIASWTTGLRALFDDSLFFDLADLAFASAAASVVVAPVLARRALASDADDARRNAARGALDASLLLAMLLATVTGYLLVYASTSLRAVHSYWHVAGWHVIASALLMAFALLHGGGFNRRALRSHAR